MADTVVTAMMFLAALLLVLSQTDYGSKDDE